MSKMSWLHAELSEQASELGFENIGEAEQAGYGIDWNNAKLIAPQEMAHKDYLKRKEIVLKKLEGLYDSYIEGDYKTNIEKATIKEAIGFIKEGEI